MKRTRVPKGQYVGLAPEFFMDTAMGGRVFLAGVAAQLTYAELFNDSQTGANLWVYGCTAQCATANEVILETYAGQRATLTGFQNPLWAGSNILSGKVGTFTVAACIGLEIGVIQVQGNNMAWWPWNWPMALIPPGFSFSLHTSNVNQNLSAGFWWLVMPD